MRSIHFDNITHICYNTSIDDKEPMMTTTMSSRELTRNGNMMGQYDYIDIEDRKSHEYKGVFISAKHADRVKAFLDKQMEEEKQKQLEEIMRFAGKGSIHPRFNGLSASQIREKKALEQYGQP